MTTFVSYAAATPRLLGRYAAHHGIPMEPTATTLQMLVDDRYLLRLRPLPGEGIMISAHLQPLPEPGRARDDLLVAYARLACGTMKEQATTCSVDARERAIWLQLPAPVNSVQDIDDAVGTFVNSLAFWSKVRPSL